MHYFVTFGGFYAGGKPAAAAIDSGSLHLPFELADALAHACHLLGEQEANVAIIDGNGNSISGDDLVACCKGEKTLSPDLRAIAAIR